MALASVGSRRPWPVRRSRTAAAGRTRSAAGLACAASRSTSSSTSRKAMSMPLDTPAAVMIRCGRCSTTRCGHVARTQTLEQLGGPPMRGGGQPVEQARGGEHQAPVHTDVVNTVCGCTALQPVAGWRRRRSAAGADAAGEHQRHPARRPRRRWRRSVSPSMPLSRAHLAAPMPDEHHVDRRDPLQHLVGPDRVQCGDTAGTAVSRPACAGTDSLLGSGSGAAGDAATAGRSQCGSQPGGASGARSNTPPAGSSTRPSQRTRSSFGPVDLADHQRAQRHHRDVAQQHRRGEPLLGQRPCSRSPYR